VEDLRTMSELLRSIGADVSTTADGSVAIEVPDRLVAEAPYELVSRMRASINVLGPLLGRTGAARVARPGGEKLGNRKLDMHFAALQAMGVDLAVVHGFIDARCNALCGARVVLEFPSVGATETVMTTAGPARGAA